MDPHVFDQLTVFAGVLVLFVSVLTASHVHKNFEMPRAVLLTAALPTGLAQILVSFGARSVLGEFSERALVQGVVLIVVGLGALVHVARVLNGRGLLPRTTPLPVAKDD